MEENSNPVGANIWASSGEVGQLMRAMDWSKTRLGPMDRWPAALSSTLSTCLSARFPMAIYWGAEGILLYNDAWRPILGDKHPWALGRSAREVWPEIWNVIGPLFASVLATGEATWRPDALLPMQRFGYVEECYFDYSFNPIRGQAGKVEGILNVVQETTYRVLNERRQRMLREVAARCASAKSKEDVCRTAISALATNTADVPFALIYSVENDGRHAALIDATGLPLDSPARVEVVDLTEETLACPWPLPAALAGSPITLESIPERFGPLPGGLWPEATTSALVLPIVPAGHESASAMLVAGINPRRQLDDDYRLLFDGVVGHIATAVTNARAHEEERKRLEALAQLDRAKTAFFSNVSHEFRTPLTLLLGPAEEMLSGTLGEVSEILQAHLLTLRRNAVRLQKLVNTLLDFARVEAGRMEARYEPVNIGLFTRDLASTFCSAVHRAGLLFVVNCPSIEEPVYVDRDMWEKIVLNLLSNALKFTFEGSLEVSVESLADRIVLTVRDTGVGIAETELAQVFDRFHRVRGARARTQEGSGIGLALVRELVKLHGGGIGLESALGSGTIFTVWIPKGCAHLPHDRIGAPRTLSSTALGAVPFVEEALRWLPDGDQEAVALPASAPGLIDAPRAISQSSERILVADDNLDMRNYLKRLLETRWDVIVVEDGAKALDVARAQRPDLVISDVIMPGRDGFDLLRELRADDRTSTIPVILLSARSGEEAKIEGLNAGADDYLVKPFTAKELLARVEALLKLHLVQREAERALRESEERYRRLIGLLPVAVYACEAPSGAITFYNDRAAELWGCAPKLGDPDWRFRGSFKLFLPDGTPLPDHETPMAVAVREGSRFRNEEVVVERADGTRITVLVNIDPVHDESGRLVGAINVFHDTTALKEAERERAELLIRERQARNEAEILNEVAQTLAAELDLQMVVQKATDAATQLTGAQFGAFFYNVTSEQGESYQLFALSGAPREAFEKFGLPRNTPLFEHTFMGKGVLRSDDITQHENYGKNPPHHGMPKGHLPVRSYLAAPVISRSGEVLGGVFFAHSNPGVFAERAERLACGIAAQAAIAIDNARLFGEAQNEIRERKAAEEAKAKLAAIVESSDDAIVSKDLNGTITSWNQGAERIFGYTPEETIGRPIEILIPADRRAEEPNILERIRRGERIDHFETIRRRKDGTLLDISLTISPIVDAAGRIIGASKIARDITERKRAEDRLRESEARFRTMADNSPIMIWVTDAEGKPAFLNRASLEYFGIAADQLATFDWAHFINPEDRDHYADAFQRALRERQVFQQRSRLRRLDGQWRWFESRGNPLFDAAGKMISYIGSSLDITEIYESQQALKELAQRKDAFLANMSHEIRSPLTGIMGYADVLLAKLKDAEDLQCLRTIKESGDYLIEIVNDILDLSKIEAGKLVLYIEPVSLHSVLAEIQSLMSVRARQKGLPLILRYDGVLPKTVQTDRTRLRQILVNLVSNAIKFTERGRVEIVARFSDPGLLEVDVIDSGIGIAPEHQQILFQPFNQADTTSARQFGGTGLGLAITKRLVEMLGGTISFESELGKGSVFRVRIPAKTAGSAANERLTRETRAIQADVNPLRDLRVLVVDDRKEICYLVSRYIKDAGGRPDEAADGETAIEMVEAAASDDPFDALILDIHMPGMDGYEVARALRAKGFRPPIIALTAGAMVGDREKCLQAGCDDYLTKPIDRHKLVEMVAQYAHSARDANAEKRAKLRILVVDDSHNACKLLSSFLEKRGHEVRAAYDGASALAVARDFCPELILLDIRLPDMSGYELLGRLKDLDSIDGARFIGVSGLYEGSSQAGPAFDHFLEKPLDMSLLDQLVRSLAQQPVRYSS